MDLEKIISESIQNIGYFIDNRFEYYQLGSYGTEAHCNRAKVKAEVMVKNVGQAVTCFAVDRN